MKEILEKIASGDGLNDFQLDKAIEFYTQMEQGLRLLGPHYHLAWVPVMHTLDALQGYKRARATS